MHVKPLLVALSAVFNLDERLLRWRQLGQFLIDLRRGNRDGLAGPRHVDAQLLVAARADEREGLLEIGPGLGSDRTTRNQAA